MLAYKSGPWRKECAREFAAWDSSLVDPVNLRLALLSAAVLGFRHGLDYDHIAAITDISSVQLKARDAMRYGHFTWLATRRP